MCFWPALSLKQKPENKDRRLPGYSSQNHKLSKAVWLFSRTGAKDYSGGRDKSIWALPRTHLWPCFNQRLHKNPCYTNTSAHCSLPPSPVLASKDGIWIEEMITSWKTQTQWDTSLGYSWFITFSLVIVAFHCLIETTVAIAILHKVPYYFQELYFPCQIVAHLNKKCFVRPTGERYL